MRTVCLSRRRRDPLWPLRVRTLVGDGGFDVVHSHAPVPAVAARLTARTVPGRRRPRLITTEHNTWPSLRRATRWANQLTSGADAATYTVTAEVLASLRGTAARRAEVLVHGIDVDRVAARPPGERAAVRAGLGLGGDDVVIATVANLRAQKDYPTLLAAARLLVERGRAFRLVAVGQGPLEHEIAARRDELGLGRHVVLAGFRPDAVGVMAACDVFVLASAWEGLPVAVMEAAALGLPIVATAVGGVAEHLGAGDAVLVPPRDPVALADALESVIADPCRRAQLSVAARSAASRFDVGRARGHAHRPVREAARAGPAGAGPPPPAATARVVSTTIRAAAGDARGQGPDPVAPRRVPRLGRRRPVRRAVRVEARAQPVRALPGLGGRARRPCRGRPLVHAMGVPPRRCDRRRGPGRRHRHAPRAPGRRPVHGADPSGVGGGPGRGGGVRVQHAQRPEPAGISEAGLARGRAPRRLGPTGAGAATRASSPGAVSRPRRGRCRSTSAPTSPPGWTGRTLAGTGARLVDGPDAAHRDRRGVRPVALRPRQASTTASSPTTTPPSSCASGAGASLASWWWPSSSATPTVPTASSSTRSAGSVPPMRCALAARTSVVASCRCRAAVRSSRGGRCATTVPRRCPTGT